MPQISESTITVSATGTAAAVTATLPASASTNAEVLWLTGLVITAFGGAAASGANFTLTGPVSGTWNFAVAGPGTSIALTFPQPIRASAANTAFVLSGTAPAATTVSLVLAGYYN